jgi:8-oxo-dGTP pyrophosphatase MutT (NUDIX family)
MEGVMRQEVSAGVICYVPGPVREYLLLDYGSHWDYPKGHVKAGETRRATALRELREETGIVDVRLLPGFEETIRYTYRKGEAVVSKQVTFFLGTCASRAVILSHEHRGYAWLGVAEALRRLTYPSARNLLAAAETFLPIPPPAER